MYCRNCGKEIVEKEKFCFNCGVKPINGTNFCEHCGNSVNLNAEICVKCGNRLNQTEYSANIHYAGFWRRFAAVFIDGFIFLIPWMTWNFLILKKSHETTIEYSQFINELNSNNVESVTIDGNEISGLLKQESTLPGDKSSNKYKSFKTYYPFDKQDIVKKLQPYNVIIITKPSSSWISLLLSGFSWIWLILYLLYYPLMESSKKQGTLGKIAMGIKVTDMQGRRIFFGRATDRYFAKCISVLTLMIGYFMAGFTKKKQALHDIIANCLVIKKA